MSGGGPGAGAAPSFTVVVTTYNRPQLVRRAVESALEQDWPELEVLVVDDASHVSAESALGDLGTEIRVVRQEQNMGVGAARNRGIREARHPWVLPFDDDDVLLPGALAVVAWAIAELGDAESYPVIKFGSTNSTHESSFAFITPDHYLRRRVGGDLIPVIRRDVFLAAGLAYPATRVGGEHLLWLKVAAEHTIPSWATPILRVTDDAGTRQTSARRQAAQAREHAELQEETLAEFGPFLAEHYPDAYRMRHTAAATYWLLAGSPEHATPHLGQVGPRTGLLLRAARLLPRRVLEAVFVLYRRWRSHS